MFLVQVALILLEIVLLPRKNNQNTKVSQLHVYLHFMIIENAACLS